MTPYATSSSKNKLYH